MTNEDGITAGTQDRILATLRRLVGGDPGHRIDGGGCESGDPVDFTLAEIEIAFAMIMDKRYEAEEQRDDLANALEIYQSKIHRDFCMDEHCCNMCQSMKTELRKTGR